jgi:hypothetical protein
MNYWIRCGDTTTILRLELWTIAFCVFARNWKEMPQIPNTFALHMGQATNSFRRSSRKGWTIPNSQLDSAISKFSGSRFDRCFDPWIPRHRKNRIENSQQRPRRRSPRNAYVSMICEARGYSSCPCRRSESRAGKSLRSNHHLRIAGSTPASIRR